MQMTSGISGAVFGTLVETVSLTSEISTEMLNPDDVFFIHQDFFCNTYLTDACHADIWRLLVTVAFVRIVFATVAVFVLIPWVTALAPHGMFTCVGCLALLINLLLLPMSMEQFLPYFVQTHEFRDNCYSINSLFKVETCIKTHKSPAEILLLRLSSKYQYWDLHSCLGKEVSIRTMCTNWHAEIGDRIGSAF
jgi:hypothetical protein